MDLYSTLVHFSVTFLGAYTLLELVSVRSLREKPYWFYIKAMFVTLGSLGAVASFFTGETVIHFVEGDMFVATYERFALATVFLSSVVAVLYLATWFGRKSVSKWTGNFIFSRLIMIPITLALGLLVFVTGGLGRAVVYGRELDPIMAPIFRLLGI